jgi:hypothetical protein
MEVSRILPMNALRSRAFSLVTISSFLSSAAIFSMLVWQVYLVVMYIMITKIVITTGSQCRAKKSLEIT